MVKTNAMRILDKEQIVYQTASYQYDDSDLSGIHAAQAIGMPASQVFKTLVTKGDKNGIHIFCIPVDRELDLKKAAAISNNKKLAMTAVKDLLSLTGYIRGGCSPIGMKKKYPTFFHQSAITEDTIAISAGVRGQQIILAPDDLISFLEAKTADIIKE